MTRTHKLVNLAGIILPVVGLVIAVVVLWERMVGPTELAILAVGYVLTGAGITVGYHRLFTHRSFETYRGVRYTFAVLGGMAVEGDVVAWVWTIGSTISSPMWKATRTVHTSGTAKASSPRRAGSGMPTRAGSSRAPAEPIRRATPRTCCATAAFV